MMDCAIQKKPQRPVELYDEVQHAFAHFNAALFAGALPFCMITLQRQKRTCGYFAQQRFASVEEGLIVDEIALNPEYFAISPLSEVMSTLVHEMVHQWQFHHGKPSRRTYHNTEWADKMEAIGLMPSSTGKPGGARTGESMGDYVIEGGLFETAFQALATQEFTLSWFDRFPPKECGDADISAALAVAHGSAAEKLKSLIALPPEKPNRSNRIKYACPKCGVRAWGKPDLRLLCGNPACNAEPLAAASTCSEEKQ